MMGSRHRNSMGMPEEAMSPGGLASGSLEGRTTLGYLTGSADTMPGFWRYGSSLTMAADR